MDKTFRTLVVSAFCLALAACGGGDTGSVTVSGSWTGSSSSECQLALRAVGGDEELIDAVSVGPEFRHEFSVPPDKKQYFVQVSCDDGKNGRSPAFDYFPPRTGMELQQITVN